MGRTWHEARCGGFRGAPRAGRRPEAAQKEAHMRRYEVRWTSLDPTTGADMAKTRPVVIISLDVLNERLQTVVVCPLTTQLHPAWRSRIGGSSPRCTANSAPDLAGSNSLRACCHMDPTPR